MGAKAYSIDEIAPRLAPLFEEKALQIVLLFGSQSSGKGHPERHAPPDDYHQSFIRAGELGILSPALEEEPAPSAGPRNRLVHEYDRIDHSIILKPIAMAEEYYPRYIEKISACLSRKA